jgi:integrase/recombinase XerD
MAKQTVKQRVKLRDTKTADNRLALYLDWSKDKKRQREYLNLHVFEKEKTVLERHHNKEIYAKAELIRAERERQFFSDEIDDITEQKKVKNQDFINYLEKYVNAYPKKDLRVMKAVLLHFKEFAPPHITAKEITETFCHDFKEHLSQTLNGESPSTYFARFKKMIRQATRDKLFRVNPSQDIRNFKTDVSIAKDVLTIEELQLMATAHCGNSEVKRAFLFCCNTGLRFVDVNALQWKNIEKNVLKIEQSKTKDKATDGGKVEITLNDTAIKILGTPTDKEDLVFKLPSHNSTVKSLDHWAKRAGIEKHITFHVARHTFGTLLAYYESDILTISKLLGHTSLKHTAKYIRTSNEMKQKAVNSIPTINF